MCKSHRVPCVRLSFVFPSNLIEAIPNDLSFFFRCCCCFSSSSFFFNFRFSHFIVAHCIGSIRRWLVCVFFCVALLSVIRFRLCFFGGSNRVRWILFCLFGRVGSIASSVWCQLEALRLNWYFACAYFSVSLLAIEAANRTFPHSICSIIIYIFHLLFGAAQQCIFRRKSRAKRRRKLIKSNSKARQLFGEFVRASESERKRVYLQIEILSMHSQWNFFQI